MLRQQEIMLLKNTTVSIEVARTLAGRPSCDELKDPKTNLEWAWKISNQGTNWSAWSVYKSGKYLQFMN